MARVTIGDVQLARQDGSPGLTCTLALDFLTFRTAEVGEHAVVLAYYAWASYKLGNSLKAVAPLLERALELLPDLSGLTSAYEIEVLGIKAGIELAAGDTEAGHKTWKEAVRRARCMDSLVLAELLKKFEQELHGHLG